jgi:hypothetical protein
MQDLAKDPDKTGIALIPCNNEKDLQRWDVDKLARELTGKDLQRVFPTFLILHQGELRGYFQTVQQLVIYPALHPDKMSPRELLKISRSLITEVKRMSGNPIFMLCDIAERLGTKNMRRVRLKKAEETAYIYDQEAR